MESTWGPIREKRPLASRQLAIPTDDADATGAPSQRRKRLPARSDHDVARCRAPVATSRTSLPQ
jgi:hypothetical protein